MTPAEAAKILELPDTATPEQVEARFLDLRRKLEDKIAKAPTPGLQAKYRETLADITAAFEALTLAADSSALPVLRREKGEGSGEKGRSMETGDRRLEAGRSGPSPSSFHPSPAPRRKSGGMEFIIVAIIAVAVLGAGGWWVMKTRAENAEKARIAAEAQAAADAKVAAEKAEAERKAVEEKRLAEEARLAAEAKRRAEEEERARLAAAEKAEQERRESLIALLRSRLAELNVTAEELLRDEPTRAARQLAELKSDERALARETDAFVLNKARARLGVQQAYVDRIEGLLSRHPAKLLQARATELLAARQPEQAEAALDELSAALQALEGQIAAARRSAEEGLHGALMVNSPHSDVTWTFTDAFGEKQTGTGSGRIERAAVGSGELAYSRPGWLGQRVAVAIRAGQPAEVRPGFSTSVLQLSSVPSGANFRLDNGATGTTPARLSVVPGPVSGSLSLSGYQRAGFSVTAEAGETATQLMELVPIPLLSDDEVARFAATLPRTNVVSDVPLATWTPVRVEVSGSVPGREAASVCLLTFRPVAMTLSQPPPAIPAGSFHAAMPETSRGGAGGLLTGGLLGMAASRATTERASTAGPGPFEADGHGHAVLSGLLHRADLTWVNKPKVEIASSPAVADAAINWLRSASFNYTGSRAPYHVLVYVVVKFRHPNP